MMECLQEQLTTFWQGTEYPSDFTAWKASKYGVLSGPYCPVFSLNTRNYEPEKTPYLDTFHPVLFCCCFFLATCKNLTLTFSFPNFSDWFLFHLHRQSTDNPLQAANWGVLQKSCF